MQPLALPLVRPIARISGTEAGAPVNVVAPAVTGTAYPMETLTCSSGTWSGSPSPTYTYQWYVDSVARSGATSATFQPLLTDIGAAIYCRVTATNVSGAVSQDSNTVTVWSPANISGVVRFWSARSNAYNSISPDVLATNGQTVRRWDGIISGTQADQATGTAQPLYRATGESGGPSLEFDGSNDTFSLPSSANVLQNKSQAYLIIGCRDTNPTGGNVVHTQVFYSTNISAASTRLSIVTRETASEFRAVARRLDADTPTSAGAASNSNFNVLAAHGDYSNGFVRLRVNGSVAASTALPSGAGSTSDTNSTGAAIGSSAAGTNFSPSHLTAVCVVNASITATELSQLERYIGLMGGLNIPLV